MYAKTDCKQTVMVVKYSPIIGSKLIIQLGYHELGSERKGRRHVKEDWELG
jgi:hypothetical protein